jgi:hypothetical protein
MSVYGSDTVQSYGVSNAWSCGVSLLCTRVKSCEGLVHAARIAMSSVAKVIMEEFVFGGRGAADIKRGFWTIFPSSSRIPW